MSENPISARDRIMSAVRPMDGRATEASKEMREEENSEMAYDLLNAKIEIIRQMSNPQQVKQVILEIEDLRDSEGYIE